MRTIAVGDVHGCSLALATLLERVGPRPDDCFVFLGDYVDRGPNSRDVIDQIMELALRCRVVPLLGNHELLFLHALESGESNPFWLKQCGGSETLISYGGDLALVPPAHRQFLRACQRYHETEREIFVHANCDFEKELAEQSDHVLFWQHLTDCIPPPHRSGKTLVTGHTPQRSGDILNLGHLICIDTGCFAGGWLTALDVESGQYWQANRFGELRQFESTRPAN